MRLRGQKNQLIAELAIADLDPDKVYEMEIREPRKKRSLDANAYYWLLLHRYAEWAGRSDAYVHNDILAHYGQPEEACGEPVYMVMVDNDFYKELDYIHLKATSDVRMGEDLKMYRTYRVMRGSHEYDTKEFSRIVDGLIQEIKGSDAPIETMTPAELATLKGYIS